MLIAINAIFFQQNNLEGYGHYAKEIFSRMVLAHPEHDFLLVFDRPYNQTFIIASNVKAIQVGPAARHVPAFLYWYNVAAVLALKKYKPAIWIQPYGFCSLTTRVPQLLVVHDLAFKHFPKYIHWHQRWHYNMFTPKFLQKATSIITVSEHAKKDIEQQYPLIKKSIKIIPGAAREGFKPLSWEEKEQVKMAYIPEGNEYFICVGGISPRKNHLNVLKAFSLFKKWHKSNMKLVIVGRLAWNYQEFLQKLNTFKYKAEVILTGYLPDEELQKLTAAAYASIYVSNFEGFGLPIVEAMQAGVPVIAGKNSSMIEVGDLAILYADAQNPKEIAEYMQLLYKDETYKQVYVDRGLVRAQLYNWDHAATAFWEEIMATVSISA